MWLGTATGIGGGTVRDPLPGLPVFRVRQPRSVGVSLIHAGRSRHRVILWLDAVGLALVSVAGAARGRDAGVPAKAGARAGRGGWRGVTRAPDAGMNGWSPPEISMFKPDFLDSFDRLVAFDAETTGKRTPDAAFIKKQPFAWKPPGIVIELGFVEMRRDGAGWRKGATWRTLVNPDGPVDPAAIAIHKIKPGDLKTAPRFPAVMRQVRDFIGDAPVVAHAYRNERDFLDYEFARAKAIDWGDNAYSEERYICTQRLFAQLFPGAGKSLTSMCDRLALDASARDSQHGALLDADMTADALVLLEHMLKNGESAGPRSWTSE